MPDLQLLTDLIAVVSALSGYPPIPVQDVPQIRMLSTADITREICPDRPRDCARIVAQFDAEGPQIRLNEELNFDFAQDRSFLVHELVHVLQHRHGGKSTSSDCPSSLRAEQEAYRVQNAYLRQLGLTGRHGVMMASMTCTTEQSDGSGLRLERRNARPDDGALFEQFMESRALTQKKAAGEGGAEAVDGCGPVKC